MFDDIFIPEKITDIYIDIGLAETAIHSIEYLSSNPTSFVFGFEPVKENCDRVLKKIKDSGFEDRFKLYECAVDNVDTPQIKDFYVTLNSLYENDYAQSSLYKLRDNFEDVFGTKYWIEKTTKVLCINLIDFLEKINWERFNKITCLKVDTQGNDLNILKSIEKYFDKFPLIYCESYTNNCYQKDDDNVYNVYEYMKNNEYELINCEIEDWDHCYIRKSMSKNKINQQITISDHTLGNYIIPEDVKGGICVDIGSNVGSFFEKYQNDFSKIYFYEPYKPCYEICLRKSNKINNVVGFNEAVLEEKKLNVELVSHLSFDSGSNAIKGNTINSDWNTEDAIGTCPSVDLETVLQRAGGKIDYLKCDCETSEYNIFLNKNLKNINYISLEIHFQMGEKKYHELLNYILKTHRLINGDMTYEIENNKELLFKNNSYLTREKLFSEEIKFFYNKLLNNEKFALSKFADGEWGAIKGENFSPANGEWESNVNDPSFKLARLELIESIRYKHSNYYVAICPCYKDTIEFSKQDQNNITFANIFVNSNYSFYKEKYISLYNERDIHLVAHKNTNLHDLPFKVEKFYPIDYNAWIVNRDLPSKILEQKLEDKLFLFAAGSFGNILAHKLWDKNKKNTYLDVGSTLNLWTKTEILKREYYMGNQQFENLTCPCPDWHSNMFVT